MVSTGAIGPSVHPPDEAPAGLSLSSQRLRLLLITSTQRSVPRCCWVGFFFPLSLPDRNLVTSMISISIARPERAKRGIDGNFWRRQDAQLVGGGMGRLGDASSKQLWQGAQHSRSACSSRHVPGSTGKQDSNDRSGCSSCFIFLSTCFKDCGASSTYRSAKCARAYTLPKWQREPTTGFAFLAGDEGDPFAQEDPLDESEEVNDSKREPTHPEGIF